MLIEFSKKTKQTWFLDFGKFSLSSETEYWQILELGSHLPFQLLLSYMAKIGMT